MSPLLFRSLPGSTPKGRRLPPPSPPHPYPTGTGPGPVGSVTDPRGLRGRQGSPSPRLVCDSFVHSDCSTGPGTHVLEEPEVLDEVADESGSSAPGSVGCSSPDGNQKPYMHQPGRPGWWAQLARLPFWLALWVLGGASGQPRCQPTSQPSKWSPPARPTRLALVWFLCAFG